MNVKDFEKEKETLQSMLSTLKDLVTATAEEFATLSASEKTQINTINHVKKFAVETIEKISNGDKEKMQILADYTNDLISTLVRIKDSASVAQHQIQGKVFGYNDIQQQVTKKINDIDSKLSALSRVEKLYEEGKDEVLDPRTRPSGERPEKISDVRLFKERTSDDES